MTVRAAATGCAALMTVLAFASACSGPAGGSERRVGGGTVITSTTTTQTCAPKGAPTALAATPPTWSPPGSSAPVQVAIRSGGTVQLRVGQRIRFRELSTVVTTPQVDQPGRLTPYGDDRTFLALAPGTASISVFNYDRHICCPSGPCAHPNAAIPMTVRIAADPRARLPRIPAPVRVDTIRSEHLRLRVGQRLVLGSGMSVRSRDGARLLVDAGEVLVASRPGHAVYDVSYEDYSGTPTTLTVDVTA